MATTLKACILTIEGTPFLVEEGADPMALLHALEALRPAKCMYNDDAYSYDASSPDPLKIGIEFIPARMVKMEKAPPADPVPVKEGTDQPVVPATDPF